MALSLGGVLSRRQVEEAVCGVNQNWALPPVWPQTVIQPWASSSQVSLLRSRAILIQFICCGDPPRKQTGPVLSWDRAKRWCQFTPAPLTLKSWCSGFVSTLRPKSWRAEPCVPYSSLCRNTVFPPNSSGQGVAEGWCRSPSPSFWDWFCVLVSLGLGFSLLPGKPLSDPDRWLVGPGPVG